MTRIPCVSGLCSEATSSRTLVCKASAIFSTSALAAFRWARRLGSVPMGLRTKFISCTKTTVVPAVIPFPDRARYAPKRNTPSWAATPVAAPKVSMMIFVLCFLHWAADSFLMFSRNMESIWDSALKDLITEKPLKLSFRVAVYTAFWSETFFSACATRSPTKREVISGNMQRPMAMKVSRGLYQSISANAPIKTRMHSTMEKVLPK